MLKPPRRITKRQIKEDKFVTYYFKSTQFVTEHLREIGAAIGLLAVIFAAYAFYTRSQLSNEQSALTAFAKARTQYFNRNYLEAATLLRPIVENYGGTQSGKLAVFYLADVLFQQKNYAEAERYFAEHLENPTDPLLEASSIAGIAACLEERGDFVQAAQTYKQAADKFGDQFMAPQNLFDAARCYNLAGDREMARTLLSQLIETYATSQIKNEAEIFLAEIT